MRETLERIFGIDPRALAVVRIGLGAILLVDLVLRLDHFSAAYTDAGAVPRSMIDPWLKETIAPLHLMSGSAAWEGLLFGVAFLAAAMLLLGLHTRIAAVVSWLLLLSLQARNPFVLNFGDQILRVCLFWALFLPLGQCWSMDAARAGRPRSVAPVLSVASAAYLLQIFLLYLFTAILKSGVDWHEDGTALYYAMQLDWMVKPLGLWLREHLLLTKFFTWSTLVLEWIGPFLLLAPFWPVRLLAALSFVALHVGISMSLRLGVFPWIDVTILLAFLPREVWDAVEAAIRRLRGAAPLALDAATPRAVVPAPSALGRARDAALLVVLAYLVVHNVASVETSLVLPETPERVIRRIGLSQKWLMFTPNVTRDDGWFVMPARLAGGRIVDLAPLGPDLRWDKPALLSREFPSARWARYLHQMSFPNANGSLRRAHVRWLCGEWNRSHPHDRAERVDVYFLLERSPPPGATPTIEPIRLSSHECPREGAKPSPGWDLAVPESGAPPPPLVDVPTRGPRS